MYKVFNTRLLTSSGSKSDSSLTQSKRLKALIVRAFKIRHLQNHSLNNILPTAKNVQATAGDGKVTLVWDAIEDRGDKLTDFDLYWSTNCVVEANSNIISLIVVDATMPSYEHIGLTNGTQYSYKIVAKSKNGSVISSFSTMVQATLTSPTQAITAPTNV